MPFVLVIGERGNSWAGRPPRASTHETQKAAEDKLLEFVQNNWDSELGDDERPEDPEEMIQYYFENVLERYEIIFAEPFNAEPRLN